MAREITAIQQQILEATAGSGIGVNSTSKRAIYRLWSFIVATAIGVFEQILDAWQVDIEKKIAAAPPGSAQWVHAQVLNFQYSEDEPQVIQLIDLAPRYPVVNKSLRIVTRCSVTTDVSNNVTVKVATGEPPGALPPLAQDALRSYLNLMCPAGITYNVFSGDADRIYVKAQIYYRGLFSSVIKTNVISAIDAYLAAIPFNGRVVISKLQDAIQNVFGVEDVILEQVSARGETVAFGSGTNLVIGNSLASRLWPTIAGYAISEDTATYTLADSLTFIAL